MIFTDGFGGYCAFFILFFDFRGSGIYEELGLPPRRIRRVGAAVKLRLEGKLDTAVETDERICGGKWDFYLVWMQEGEVL